MKSIIKIIFISSIMISSVECSNKNLQYNNAKDSEGQKKSSNPIVVAENSHSSKQYTTEELYSIFETQRDSLEFLLSKASNQIREKETNNGKKTEFECFYVENTLVGAAQRLYDENGIAKYWSFSFNKYHNCCLFTVKENRNAIPQAYLHWNGLTINSNANLQPLIVNQSTLQPLLILAKEALDSTMRQFPGFKYTFDWQ